MGLKTPENIRTLQRKLYLKAKAEPAFRFYLLYDKIYREDILAHAYRLAKANAGIAGVDGVTFDQIESEGLDDWLSGIREQLRTKTYKPQPVLRVMIPKPGGGQRPLGIPTIRDRVVQTAVKMMIEPIFEADLEPNTYGYRPKRSAVDAIKEVHKLLKSGFVNVVDADLSKYFDTIPHTELMQCVTRRISDRNILRLIKQWLKVPVQTNDRNGKRHTTGGRGSRCGTPQGGVVSPLLANVYMNRFLKYWRLKGCGDAFKAKLIAYADDFVILSRGHASQALEWTRQVMERIGLSLNMEKTSLKDARKEHFDFLGYTFGLMCITRRGEWHMGVEPSERSVKRLKGKIRNLLKPGEKGPWPEVRDRLNQLLRGWCQYYCYGWTQPVYRGVERNVYNRVRNFLVRRHKMHSRGIRQFPSERVFGGLGVLLPRPIRTAARCVP
jgi:RNA-directed DNA polymerase